MKFNSLEIKNFRHIQSQKIEIGNVLTAIAGQNGTGKSTIMGWIAQSCDSKLHNKTFLNTSYKSKYSEIFRFCPEKDHNKNYEVILNYLEDDDLGIEHSKKMTTRLIQSDERYRVDFDNRGVALDFPIIYLGLKRLIPLATEKIINIIENNFEKSDQSNFSKLSKEILFLTRDDIKPESIKSTNKSIVAMKTDSYGHLGNSAGQDNLGQIISSVLSFGKLKKELKDNYYGGVLLIDEIDATLYSGSQIKLVEKLYSLAKSLKIQIIFTTHSIEILEFLSKKSGDDSKINFLKWKNKSVFNEVNPNIDYIINNIKVQTGIIKKIEKNQFMCEDIVAEQWAKILLNGSELKDIVEIKHGPFPFGTLEKMILSKHKIFKDFKIVLDGDCKSSSNTKKLKNTAYLPGNSKPEKEFFNFIFSLDDEDEFWDITNNFTHQTCFGNYGDKDYKRWYNDEANKRFFGRANSKLLNRWKKSHPNETQDFIYQLKKILK